MRPVPVLSDYLVKLVIPSSRAILKPAVIYRFVSLVIGLEKKRHPRTIPTHHESEGTLRQRNGRRRGRL